MAKKVRKSPNARPAPVPVVPSTEPADPPEVAPLPAVTSVVAPRPGAMSPLLRSQEVELEIGLTILGTVVGVLSGYTQNVSMGAPSGNLAGAIEAGVVGALMGYSLGRTLFFSVRNQWISWGVVIALVYVGYWLASLPGSVGGAVLGTVLVIAGVFGSEDDEAGPAPATRWPPSPQRLPGEQSAADRSGERG